VSRDWNAAWAKVEAEGHRCRVCRSNDARNAGRVDPAHLIHRSVGGGMDADEIVPLCRVHHTAYDSGQLDLLPYLGRSEQVAAVRVAGLYRAYHRVTGEAEQG
jgi:hypothetical protein